MKGCLLVTQCALIVAGIFHFLLQSNGENKSQPELTVEPIQCIVSVTHKLGRLGNRMFVLASAYALARIHSCDLYISPLILDEIRAVFKLNFSLNLLSHSRFRSLKSVKFINKTLGCEYQPSLTQLNAIPNQTRFEVHGFWQSYLYFHDYRTELQEEIFGPRKFRIRRVSSFFRRVYENQLNVSIDLSTDNHQLLKEQLSSTQWIGIHIRLGDFVPLNLTSNSRYLFDSMNYFQKQYGNVHFIVASDNKTYCEDLFRDRTNVILTPRAFGPADDLLALSLCQHSIVTGGTFGWWSAYLAGGQVLHDAVYPSPCAKRNEYFPSWFRIN